MNPKKGVPCPVPAPAGRENASIRFLTDFCRAHPLDEKLLIVPSFSAGRQIGERLSRSGCSWVNLRFVTLHSLAHETAAAEMLRLGRTPFTDSGLIILLDTAFRELKDAGGLEYFGRLEARPGLARSLLRAVEALRMSAASGARLEAERFCVPSKGRDIVRIVRRYEELLDGLRACDRAAVFSMARELRGLNVDPKAGPSPAWFLCLDGLALRKVERDFLESAAAGRLILVPSDPVLGLERPRGIVGAAPAILPSGGRKTELPPSDAERLAWLFDPAGAPPPVADGSVGFFRAVGQANECREVVRRVMAEGGSFDGVEIITPAGSVYPAVLHLMSTRCGVPVTLADGLPLVFTAPGRAFFGLADWIEGRFPAPGICHLIEAGDIALPPGTEEDDLPAERAGRILRGAMIGWGRDRYVPRLEAYRRSLEADLRRSARREGDERTPEADEELRKEAEAAGRLTDAFRDFLSLLPEAGADGSFDFAALAEGLAAVLDRHVRVKPDPEGRDRAALDLITGELRSAAGEHRALAAARGLAQLPLGLAGALERLRAAVSSLTVGACAPLPGHLHVSSYTSGGYSGRGLTFVVGLNDTAAPGEGSQDPILLDAERQALSESLPTTTDMLKSSLYSLAALLASLRGRVVLSYSSYDIIDDRRLYPSSVLLQALRLMRGDPGLDYSDLDAAFRADAEAEGRLDPAGFIPASPSTAVDERDWWLGRLFSNGQFIRSQDSVETCFPVLRDGVISAKAKDGPELSSYEGLVTIDPSRFDPLVNHGLVLSASKLERLAKCPYGYFLRHVLDVEPPEDLALDRSRWLDPRQRGSLIHQILFEFMAEVAKRGERVSGTAHAALMDAVAGRVIREWKDDIPPPSDGIFDKELRDILESLGLFLKIESEREPDVRPVAFEKEFSDVAVAVGPGKSFLLRGFIDRIDRTGPHTYRVVDYKTGSYREYEDFEAFGRGRMIQPALYALAAEEILEKDAGGVRPRVTESGYFFPTRRGEGREITVGEFDRSKLRELLAGLLDLIRKGYFVTTTRDECGFCDYAAVCGGAFERTKEKLEGNPAVLEALNKLKRYA